MQLWLVFCCLYSIAVVFEFEVYSNGGNFIDGILSEIFVRNRSSSLLSGSKMPREIEYDFLAGAGYFLALSQSSVPWRGTVVNMFCLFIVSSVSNLLVEGVIEWQHTAKWFLNWHSEYVDLYA